MINLDHGAFRHCAPQLLVLRSDLTPILFLEAVLVRRDPNDCATDYALDVKHVLQESTKNVSPFRGTISVEGALKCVEVPKDACEHALKVSIATSAQLGSQHESRKGVVPRERFRLVASGCDVHRVSTMQSKSLDRALSLRMSGHMKRLRVSMHTIVESNVTLQQGARGAEAAD